MQRALAAIETGRRALVAFIPEAETEISRG